MKVRELVLVFGKKILFFMVVRRSQKSKWWQEKRKDLKCERCGRKIEKGRFCYYCGKYKGLW